MPTLISEKLTPIRKGLSRARHPEIIAADKVYVADMLKLLSDTRVRDAGRDAVSVC